MRTAGVMFVLMSTALSLAVIPGLALLHRRASSPAPTPSGATVAVVSTVGAVALSWFLLGSAVVAGDHASDWFIGIPGVAGLDTRLIPFDASSAYIVGEKGLLTSLRVGVLGVAASSALVVTVVRKTTTLRATAFATLWALVAFLPVAGWIYAVRWVGAGFSGGWLAAGLHDLVGTGALDYGGGAMHVALGASLLALVTRGGDRGNRKGVRSSDRGESGRTVRPRSGPALLAGAFLLWVGSVASAGGAEGEADTVAALAVVNALTAPAAACLAWLVVEHITEGRATPSGGVRGVVVGVAVISAGSGYLTPALALLLGLGMGALGAVVVGRDEGTTKTTAIRGFALLHLIGGTVGIIALGVAAAGQGVLYSGTILLVVAQVILCVAVAAFAFAVTWVLASLLTRRRSRTLPPVPPSSVQESALA